MNPEWQEFLDTRVIEPWPADGRQDVLVDLSERGMIGVYGDESVKFLQGQLTSDVSEVGPALSQLSAWCSAKGRVLVVFRAFRLGDALLLSLPRNVAAATGQRMKMFVLRARVRIVDESDDWVQMGCQGAAVGERLANFCGAIPKSVNAVIHQDELTVIRVPGDPPRFEIIGSPRTARTVWETLADVASPTAPGAWALGDVRAGLPRIYPENADQYLPQMLNLEVLGGVSFTKGCYVGQEIVARAHYLGRVKRRMRRARLDGSAVPEAGANVLQTGDQRVGRVLYAAATDRNGSEALVVLGTEIDLATGLRLENGPRLTLETLPYEVSARATEPASSN